MDALNFIEAHSIRRAEFDWQTIRDEMLPQARAFESLDDAHTAIRDLLELLNDGHSFLHTPETFESFASPDHAGMRLHQSEPTIIDIFPDGPAHKQGVKIGDRVLKVGDEAVTVENWAEHYRSVYRTGHELTLYSPLDQQERRVTLALGFAALNPLPDSFKTPAGYGLIDLPGHMGDGELPGGLDYASEVRKAFYALEAESVSAWIIDLRRCDGGNMWPMLAGLTPLLGIGDYGSFADIVGSNDWVWGFDGVEVRAHQNEQKGNYIVKIPDFLPLKKPDAPVAVLTSEVTSSSGEFIVIAFLGRPQTRTFGLPTGGLTSSNSLHALADGSELFLKAHLGADRLRHVYNEAIQPDTTVPIDWSLYGKPDDPVIVAAEVWLQNWFESGQ